jgi:hypothetical protein
VYPPVEIIYDRHKTFPGLQHVIDKNCGSSSRGFNFPAAKKTIKIFADQVSNFLLNEIFSTLLIFGVSH